MKPVFTWKIKSLHQAKCLWETRIDPEYERQSRIRYLNLRNGFGDSYTDRSLADRCLMGFNSGPPMKSGSYNNNDVILQAPGYVAIVNEMVHNSRIIPLDGRSHGDLRQYAGVSRGRWEGCWRSRESERF